jgi:hydrogenase expression/formation protein HypE
MQLVKCLDWIHYIANEGKLIVVVPAKEATQALLSLKNNIYGKNAVKVGEVRSEPKGMVLMHTLIGGTRILDMLAGEMLPRIC